MASRNFTIVATNLAKGVIDYDTEVFYAMLVTAIPSEANLDGWGFRSDVTSEHAATGNYTTGGFLCDSSVAAQDDPTDSVDINIVPDVGNGNAVFTSSTITAVGAIIFRQIGGSMATPATDNLVSFVDFGGTITSTNGDFNVTFSTPMNIDVN